MEWIVAKLGIGAVKWTVGGIAGLGAAWVLKRIPNGKIKAKTRPYRVFSRCSYDPRHVKMEVDKEFLE